MYIFFSIPKHWSANYFYVICVLQYFVDHVGACRATTNIAGYCGSILARSNRLLLDIGENLLDNSQWNDFCCICEPGFYFAILNAKNPRFGIKVSVSILTAGYAGGILISFWRLRMNMFSTQAMIAWSQYFNKHMLRIILGSSNSITQLPISTLRCSLIKCCTIITFSGRLFSECIHWFG